MKKLVFGLIAVVMLSVSSFANQNNSPENKEKKSNDEKETVVGRIKIHFHGGNLCWLSGSACEGDILIEWKTAPPKDINPIDVPACYHIMTMETTLFEKTDQRLEARVFTAEETEDGSTIFIPAQVAQYSKELDAFVVYATSVK